MPNPLADEGKEVDPIGCIFYFSMIPGERGERTIGVIIVRPLCPWWAHSSNCGFSRIDDATANVLVSDRHERFDEFQTLGGRYKVGQRA